MVMSRTKNPLATRQAIMSVRHERDDPTRFDALDVSTARVWLGVARARLSGVSPRQIAELLAVDGASIERLVASPPFQVFEADYRLHIQDSGEMEKIRAELMGDMREAREAVLHWLRQRVGPGAAQASLRAATLIGEWSGFAATLGGRGGAVGIRATKRDLPDGRVEILLEAAAKMGA